MGDSWCTCLTSRAAPRSTWSGSRRGTTECRCRLEGPANLRWGKDREIFYVELVETGGLETVPDDVGTLVSVPIETAPTLSAGSPTRLFSSPGLTGGDTPMYDVFADGKRFLMPEPIGEPPPPVIRVVQNWFEEFQDRRSEVGVAADEPHGGNTPGRVRGRFRTGCGRDGRGLPRSGHQARARGRGQGSARGLRPQNEGSSRPLRSARRGCWPP